MDRARLIFLFHSFFSDAISAGETKELLDYISVAEQQELSAAIDEALSSENLKDVWEQERMGAVYSKIIGDKRFISTGPNKLLPLKRYLAVAAALFIVLSVSFSIYYIIAPDRSVKNGFAGNKGPLRPGYDQAVLSLGDEKRIRLDSQTAVNTSFGGASIRQHKDRLDYTRINPVGISAGMNTLSTPRGGQFSVTLGDGTRVWLNAATRLRYPAVFTGSSRMVELTGEAYFEVAKDNKHPFKVSIGGTVIQVLGTHFNVNAYKDQEEISTVLLEGSVRLSNKDNSAVLKPGEEARMERRMGRIAVRTTDLQQAVAWRRGMISFKDEDIAQIMKKISRWYDADIEFTRTPGRELFGGTMNRNKPLVELLKNLEVLCDVKFKIEGRRIIVTE